MMAHELGGTAPDHPDESQHRPISFQKVKEIQHMFNKGLEDDWSYVTQHDRLMLLEVCCSPESELTRACHDVFGNQSAQRVSYWNGGDVETTQGRQHVKNLILEKRPRVCWCSPECGPFSPMQRLNRRSEKQRKEFEENVTMPSCSMRE